jgi:hypothetical protein
MRRIKWARPILGRLPAGLIINAVGFLERNVLLQRQ